MPCLHWTRAALGALIALIFASAAGAATDAPLVYEAPDESAHVESAAPAGGETDARAAAGPTFDVIHAVEGVWAYDPRDVETPGDFTCASRPLALTLVDGGARIAALRYGEEAERYGLVLDVRNDFPLGPALSIVWEDAKTDEAGDPEATILFMEDADTFAWIRGSNLQAYLDAGADIERTARRARCRTKASADVEAETTAATEADAALPADEE